MKQRDWGLLLLLIAVGSRRKASVPLNAQWPWAPMGPFPEENTIPSQPKIPPNPLDPKAPK